MAVGDPRTSRSLFYRLASLSKVTCRQPRHVQSSLDYAFIPGQGTSKDPLRNVEANSVRRLRAMLPKLALPRVSSPRSSS
jgi:hypothetical protein